MSEPALFCANNDFGKTVFFGRPRHVCEQSLDIYAHRVIDGVVMRYGGGCHAWSILVRPGAA